MYVYIVMSHNDGITALNGAFMNKSEAEKMKAYFSRTKPEQQTWIEPMTVVDYPEES